MHGFVRCCPTLILVLACGRTVLSEEESPITGSQAGSASATGGVQAGGEPSTSDTGAARTGGASSTGAKTGGSGTPSSGGKVATGGGPSAGGKLATDGDTTTGGKSAVGSSLSSSGGHWTVGGVSSMGGARQGTAGAATGGASNAHTASSGGMSASGGAAPGGTSPSSGGLGNAGSLAAGTSALGGSAAGGANDGGITSTGGDSGALDPHLDPAGDATNPSGDLLEAHVYVSGDTVEIQIRFGSQPVPERLSTEVTLASATDPFYVLIDRYDGELQVHSVASNVTLSYETCSTTRVNPTTGWLSVRLPLSVVPDARFVRFAIASAHDFNQWDEMDAGWIAVDPELAPDRGAVPVCEPSSRVRKSAVRFRDVSLGWDFGCGLDLTGAAVCWGTDEAMGWVGKVPQGAFDQIAVSNQWITERIYACGRRSDGSIECWGDRPPQWGPTKLERIGEPFGCGILSNGMTFAMSDDGQAAYSIDRPSGTAFVDVTGFGSQHCGLRSDGVISCTSGITEPVGNDFVAVELGTETDACGLHRDGTLACGEGRLPRLVFKQIDSPDPNGNLHYGCGVQPNGAPLCWGGAGTVVRVAPGPFKRIEVSTSGEGVCGLKDDDTLECWHYSYVAGNPIPATTPP